MSSPCIVLLYIHGQEEMVDRETMINKTASILRSLERSQGLKTARTRLDDNKIDQTANHTRHFAISAAVSCWVYQSAFSGLGRMLER